MDLDRMNIDASITDLSRAEKVLLIYLSIQNQIVNSQGDLAKTINSTANQQKIFAEQSARLARVIGDVLNPVFGKLLAVVNGVLMVFVELISAFASLVGFELPKYETGTNDFDWVDDLDTGLGSANEKAKSLKKSLRGFDKLNVVNSSSNNGGGGVSGGGLSGAGIMGDLLGSLSDYDMKMKALKNKATDIRDKIMEWLGFTKEVDKETGEISWKFDRITGGTVLGAMAVGGIIYKGAELVLKFLKKIGLIKFDNFKDFTKSFKESFDDKKLKAPVSKFTSLKNAVLGVVQAGAGLFIFTDSIRDINENGLGLLNTIGLVAGGLMSFQGIFTTITSLAQLFGVTMSSSMALATGGISLIITGLAGLITHISKSSKESESFALQIDKLNEKYKQLDETAKENALTNMAQTTRTVALINELKNLVDENGKVKAGYEERTNYILKYTNEALGTEYELVGNVIKQNGKVIGTYDTIYAKTQDIIKLRKAEMILEAYKDKYVELLKDEQEVKNDLELKQTKLNIKQTQYNDYIKQGKDENSSFMKTLKNNIEAMTLEVENQKITLDAFRTDIQDYEKLQEMIINNSVEDVNKAIRDVMKETEIKLKESTTNIKNDYDKKFSSFDANISVGVIEKPQFNSFKNSLNNMKATVKVDANTTEAQRKINNLSSSLATSFKVAINYDKKYSKIDISGVTGHANGGFPEDGWFRASKGELMGKFDDGTSIVANNRQVVDGVRQMLRDGMMDALVMANNKNGNKQNTQVTIIAEDNDLLNGIKFKEKQRERQFGY